MELLCKDIFNINVQIYKSRVYTKMNYLLRETAVKIETDTEY